MINIELNKYEKALYYEIFINNEYSVLDSLIFSSSLILDVGSNIGLFSLYCLKINNNIKIHLFEPIVECFEKSKLLLHDFHNNINFNNIAIGSHESIQPIYINTLKPMQSSVFNNTFLNKTGCKVDSKFINLYNYILDNNISNIDLLKIDIEGSEFDVLLNIDDNFFINVSNIFIEFHLFNIELELKYKQLLERLKKIYKNVQILPNKYSDKLGYLLCTNNENN